LSRVSNFVHLLDDVVPYLQEKECTRHYNCAAALSSDDVNNAREHSFLRMDEVSAFCCFWQGQGSILML